MIPVCSDKFFRLPLCLAKDSLIVNTGRSSVSSVQFHSYKELQSWTLKQPRSFSCPAVYIERTNELTCVIDKHVIVIWNCEADSLDEAKEIKFHDEIFAVISVGNQELVVFNSGSCLLLEDAISKHEYIMQPYLKNEESLLWADASTQDMNILIFLLTSMQNVGHKLHSLHISVTNGKIEQSYETVISRDSVSLQSWCRKSEDLNMSFIVIWSDGQVHNYSDCSKPSAHLFTIPGITDEDMLAVEAVDSCHLVTVRYEQTRGMSYEIWDTRYATRKTSKSINFGAPQNLQVRVLGNILFLASSRSIVSEPLEVMFAALSDVIGKSSSKNEALDIFYSWEPDGLVQCECSEEQPSDEALNSKFSTVTTNELFDELLSRLHQGDTETISSCLKEIKLISETKLVRLLQHLLRDNHPQFSEKSGRKKASPRKSRKHFAKIFTEFFHIPYNDVFLQKQLRKLSFKEAVATLEILFIHLKEPISFDACSDSSYTQILSWACLLLYSHFEEFLLYPDMQHVLEELDDVLKDKLIEYSEVEHLSKSEHKKLDFESCTPTYYCIEVLYL